MGILGIAIEQRGLGVGEIFAMGIHGIAMEKREFVLEGVQYANLAMGFMWGSKYIDVPYQISHRGCGIVNPDPLHQGNGLCYGDYVNSHRTERDGSLGSLVSWRSSGFYSRQYIRLFRTRVHYVQMGYFYNYAI